MKFTDIEIKYEYRTTHDSIPSVFYLPILSCALGYDRAVGYFSSSSLIRISKGIVKFAQNGGHMRLIASPALSEEDIIAIREGYKKREEIINDALMSELERGLRNYDVDSKNLLANLIADGILDVRIALTTNDKGFGIYHEKMGLFYDCDNNVIAFTGSMNETYTGLEVKYESVDVFCSWRSGAERERIYKTLYTRFMTVKDPNAFYVVITR